MRNESEKRSLLFLGTASLMGIVVLAAALEGFVFSSPYTLLNEGNSTAVNLTSHAYLTQLLVFLTLVLLSVVATIFVLDARHRRRLLFLLLLLAFLLIYTMTVNRSAALSSAQPTGEVQPASNLQGTLRAPQATLTPLLDIGAPQVTPELVWLLSLGLAGMLVGLGVLAGSAWRSSHRQAASPLQVIAASAKTALQVLELGGDVHKAILRCYQAMLEAAAQSRGVQRPEYLTPSEFIQRLVHVGLPREPVERLTHLFETARYSSQPPTTAMEVEATVCLQAIVAAAKEEQ